MIKPGDCVLITIRDDRFTGEETGTVTGFDDGTTDWIVFPEEAQP